jgi:hypothetical protein
MNKYIFLITLVLVFVFQSANCRAESRFAPYYSIDVSEGASIPSNTDWLFSLNLTNDMGLVYQPTEQMKYIGFYELKYTGPGFRQEEGQQFSDSNIDHVFVLKNNYAYRPDVTIKTQLDYMRELTRTAANEVWGSGLYDFNRVGFAVTVEKKYSDKLIASAFFGYHQLDFPNYTDLLSELQSGGDNATSSTGKQNHAAIDIGVSCDCGPFKSKLSFLEMDYVKQKVITQSVQADGSFYSNTLQQDTLVNLAGSCEVVKNKKVRLWPELSLKLKHSNQNYQYFAVAVSSVPAQYVGDYYDYTSYSFAVPFSYTLSDKWEYFLNPQYTIRNYSSRPPRDANDNFLAGNEVDNLLIVATGFNMYTSQNSHTTFLFAYQAQDSNMKFERYLPYNYSGTYFGINFNFVY